MSGKGEPRSAPGEEQPGPTRAKIPLPARAAAIALALALLAIGALWLWSPAPCAHPSCVVQRFTISVEIDALGGVQPIAFEVEGTEGPRSLQSILREGGIEVRTHIDQTGLPYDAASGPLDRADLYQLVTAWRNQTQQSGADASLYALFTPGLVSDSGEQMFGIMFDTAGREGFALAPRTTERFFAAREPDAVATLQLRTFVHELLHALNRHHGDAVALDDGRLTLEAPTRCISDTASREWTLHETPLLALSPDTIRFLQTASRREVLPGPGHDPLRKLRTSSSECDDARARVAESREPPRLATLLARLRDQLLVRSAEAAESAEDTGPLVDIRLQAQPASYPLGYPIAIRVRVKNVSDEPLTLQGRLDPAYAIVSVEYRKDADSDWNALEPLWWFEPSSDDEALLGPGEETEETIPIYYGEGGWTFPEPGSYAVRIRINTGDSRDEATSEPLELSIAAPRTPADQAAIQPLLTPSGELDPSVGRLLAFGGRIGKPQELLDLEQVTQQLGHTAIGGALHLTLLSQRLRRPIDPATGVRPAPDFASARELLDDTCTDSGIAALSSDLLEQRDDALPVAIRRRIESQASAWEGHTRERSIIATYSDDQLVRWGPSIHFCLNDADLTGSLRREVRSLARQLRAQKPERVVVVGHTDRSGTCRFNSSLAAQRADSVARMLGDAGIPRDRIVAVSLGERRPADFATDEDAFRANRRVEILVEGSDLEAPTHEDPLLPACVLPDPTGFQALRRTHP